MLWSSGTLLHVLVLHAFLGLNDIPLCEHMTVFTHSSADGHLSYSHIFTAVNSAAVTLHEQVFSSVSVLISLGYRPRRGAVGSWGNLRAMGTHTGLWCLHNCYACVRSYSTPLGLPQSCSGWESSWQCRRHGSDPCSGKSPHATQQLSPCVTATGPTRPRAHVPQQAAPTRRREQPHSPQLEKAHTQQRRPSSAINKQINLF